jgi:hypothetical protein
MSYAPLRDAGDELDELNRGFETWLFRCSTNLHNGLLVGVMVFLAVGSQLGEPIARTVDLVEISCAAVMIVGRTAAHRSPVAHRELARHACTAFFILLWVALSMLDVWAWSRGTTFSDVDWLNMMMCYALGSVVIHPALALSFALPPWAAIAFNVTSTVPCMYLLVQQTPSSLTPTSSVQAAVALGFMCSQGLGAAMSLISFAMLRHSFDTMGRVGNLADAKSRCAPSLCVGHCVASLPTSACTHDSTR